MEAGLRAVERAVGAELRVRPGRGVGPPEVLMDQHEVVDRVAAQDLAHDLRQRLDGQRSPGVGDGVLERVHERPLLREQRPAALR